MTELQQNQMPRGDFLRGYRIQANVIGALLMREIHTRYGRDNVGYMWMFLEPMMLAFSVGLLHIAKGGGGGSDIAPIPFAVSGYAVFIMFRGMVTRAEGALESNMPLLYHRSVTIFDMMFSRAILEGSSTFVTFVVLMGLAAAFDMTHPPARLPDLLIGIGQMAWISFALSMLIVALTHENRLAARLVHPTTYILMPLSGAFYQVRWIPEPYRSYLGWFPLPSIFEEVRYGWFYDASSKYIYSSYVTIWCIFLTYCGMLALKHVRKQVHLS